MSVEVRTYNICTYISKIGVKNINLFERNYWSLYFDFIEGFQLLNLDGYSLPLLCNFYGLIKDNQYIKTKLRQESFSEFLINKGVHESDIQKKFDCYLNLGKKDYRDRKSKGHIVLHDKLLRFPNRILNDNFSPSETILLSRNSIARRNNHCLPIDNLLDYVTDTTTLTKFYLEKATNLFTSYCNHIIFSNSEFQNQFCKEIPIQINNIVAARNFLNKVPVSCLVLGGTNNPESRVLALAARKQGIPSICMQHGIIALEFGYLPRVATIQAVYGNYEVDWYLRKGVSTSSLKIIGHPRFDEIFSRTPLPKNLFEQKLGLDSKKKLVLLILHHQEIEISSAIIKILLETQQVNIIIKPRENSGKGQLLKRKFPAVYLSKNIHLYDLMQNVDAVISYPSTVALEAILANKPVFIWKMKMDSSSDYFDSIGEFIQSDPVKLVEILLDYLNNGDLDNCMEQTRNRFIASSYPNPQELSIDRLKKIIIELINVPF